MALLLPTDQPTLHPCRLADAARRRKRPRLTCHPRCTVPSTLLLELFIVSILIIYGGTVASAFGVPTGRQNRLVHTRRRASYPLVLVSSRSDKRSSAKDDDDSSDSFERAPNVDRKRKQLLHSKGLTKSADASLSSSSRSNSDSPEETLVQQSTSALNRRLFMGAALLGASAILAQPGMSTSLLQEASAAQPLSPSLMRPGQLSSANKAFGTLEWESTPINKRTGVTVFDAEKAGYNVRFVTYLARFLLVFDEDCQKWWYSRASVIPFSATAKEVENIRLKQFGAFAASVEVGLQDYEGTNGKDGPGELLQDLLERYCPTMETVEEERDRRGLAPLTEPEEGRERREIKEARRQIALLFAFLESTQPVEALNKLLASIDNGSIASVTIEDGGGGYAPGYGPPRVEFPSPNGGEEYRTATGRATLYPNGKILRVDLENRGFGYMSAPNIEISPPGAELGVTIPGAKGATAKAYIYKSGVNKGRLERVQIEDPGLGYLEGEKIRVVVSPPDLPLDQGGVKATAKPVLEYSVASIEIVDGGSGYAIEKQIPVFVEPPPLTARINLNDPVMARVVDPTKPIPASAIPTPEQRKLISKTNSSDPNSFTNMMTRLATNNGLGGGGGCVGRACYDQPVIALATAQSQTSSFSTFRNETEARLPAEREKELFNDRFVRATTSGLDSQLPAFWNGVPSSSSAQLLTLLPPGLGLEYDRDLKRFVLAASPDFVDINAGSPVFGGSSRPLNPEFGPRGRSPIERDLQLDPSSYIRFCASGAVCASGVHLILTPLDVVKTKLQTDPNNYPDPITAFRKVVADRGPTGFFSGWAPTFIGFFFWGGGTYSLTELLRRYFNEQLGPQAANLEVPVILTASAVGAFVGTFILVPFESIRIRSVAQPDYGKNFFDATSRMIKEEGLGSLFSAVPPFLLKEVPFNTAKFAVFTVMTRYLYETFPAAKEDIQLSLLVSLAGGILGGLVAAVVSNPADCTISEMKKARSDITPLAAAQGLVEKGGYANLMRGLPVRMAFYPLVVSLQFLVYDAVRIYLRVGADDLKVYLDVLGGALKGGGSMVGPV